MADASRQKDSREDKQKDIQEKLPIDAKLLSDAIIELNISRRSVGLYPSDHPITKQFISRAYEFLKKLFELRSGITLGIAKDILMIDEYTLDKKNPIFREFALALHTKGIAAVTFHSGLEEKELLSLYELITEKDLPVGQALSELGREKGIKHIRLIPIDISKVRFVEGVTRKTKGGGKTLWEDYIFGLMEGRLADNEVEGMVFDIPPEQIAFFLNNQESETSVKVPAESYDRIITAYLKKRDSAGLSRESMSRFMKLLESLSPELKGQFLSSALKYPALSQVESEDMLKSLTPEDMERMVMIFKGHSNLPESLKNLINRLSETKKMSENLYKNLSGGGALLHDIEFDDTMMKLLAEDHFRDFVTDEYQKELSRMLGAKTSIIRLSMDAYNSMRQEAIDSVFSEVLLELINFDRLHVPDYLKLITNLSELTTSFLETGRFEEVCDIHNALYSHMLEGKFKTEAQGIIEYFFHSKEFISKLLESFAQWGRYQRDSALRLAMVLRLYITTPLMDILTETKDASQRKFFLYILSHMGKEACEEAVKRLNDGRWHVVRNMIYLIKECGGKEYAQKIRPFARHKNARICIEAVKTLLHFKTPDSFSYLKLYLTGKDPELKKQAIILSGSYKLENTVQHLVEILEKRDILSAELPLKVAAVRALGNIGNSKALDALQKAFTSKKILFKEAAEELKMEIIKSLDNYPQEGVRPIIDLALASKNEEIRSLAEKLLLRSENA